MTKRVTKSSRLDKRMAESDRLSELQTECWEAEGRYITALVNFYGGPRSEAVECLILDLQENLEHLRKDGM